jgi:hypothetical protein
MDICNFTSNIILTPHGILFMFQNMMVQTLLKCTYLGGASLNLGRENDYATEVFVVFLSPSWGIL